MKMKSLLPVFLLLLISILLRVFALENIPGFLGDEGWGFTQFQLYHKNLEYTFNVPSGRSYNPLYGIVPWLTQAADPFSMRFPSVVIGCGILVLCFYLFKKSFGGEKALLITLLIACFPPHIHYARLAWDCCLIPLFSLFLTYFILEKRPVAFLLTMIPAFSIHPSLAMLIVPGFLVYDGQKKVSRKILIPAVALLFLASVAYINWKGVPLYVPDVESSGRYFYGIFDFLAGTIVSQDPADSRIPFVVFAFMIFMILGAVFAFKNLTGPERRFFFGTFLSFLALYLVRGVWPALPGHERSILYAGIPLMVIIFSFLEKLPHTKNFTLLLSGLYLTITFVFYFEPAISHGGHGLQTRSGPNEPKYAAAEWIVKNHKGEVRVIAEDWGIYWNSYNHLLGNVPEKITMKRMSDQPGFSPESKVYSTDEFKMLMDEGAFAIGFRGGLIDKIIHQEIQEGRYYSRVGFKDYSGEDFIYVWIRER